jgi:hypothetical protein
MNPGPGACVRGNLHRRHRAMIRTRLMTVDGHGAEQRRANEGSGCGSLVVLLLSFPVTAFGIIVWLSTKDERGGGPSSGLVGLGAVGGAVIAGLGVLMFAFAALAYVRSGRD